MIALISAFKSNILTFKNIKQNIFAGIMISMMTFPLAIACAIGCGLTPESGIYTAIIANFLAAIFGGTQVQISGPTGALVVILAQIHTNYGATNLQATIIISGILLTIIGFFKLSSLLKHMPYTVIMGLTTGIGLIIFINQWESFLGLDLNMSHNINFFYKIKILFRSLPKANVTTCLMAYTSLIIYFLSQRYIKNIPASLITLISSTTLTTILNSDKVATIGSHKTNLLPLPYVSFAAFSDVNWITIIAPACTIALLIGMESLLSLTAIDATVQAKNNANQELVGQGIANIFSTFFGGFASTGTIYRTIINIRYGGNCPIAAITNSAILLIVLYFGAPYLLNIPLCAIATILFVVAYNMSDLHQFCQILFHAPWYDTIVLLTTCFLTITVDLVFAVTFGSLISILLFTLRTYQTNTNKTYIFATLWKETITQVSSICENNTIRFKIKGPFFFGAADKLEQAFALTDSDPSCIVFNFSQVPFIDMTGLTIFYKIVQQYHLRGVRIYVENANDRVMKKLQAMHIDQFLEEN